MGREEIGEKHIQKSHFDVLGLCCSSEVPLIEKILRPLNGVEKVSIIVPSKTVIVLHDANQISQLQIAKALNDARLEASIRTYGTEKIINKWPNPFILACGLLLLVSLFDRFFRPLRWVALGAVALGLPKIVMRSIASIRVLTLDINILMLIAVGGTIALRDYIEAGFVVFLFTIAEWLQSLATHKATAGMSSLISMAPQKAILAETGEVVDAKDVTMNTIIAIKAGEVIPIDGIVVEGQSEVDERTLTGESFPIAKHPQSLVWAGTLNIDGYIGVKTTALAEHSAVAKMAALVEEAQNSRSRTQRMIDSCTKYYTPAVVVIAGCLALIPLIMRAHNLSHWFHMALVFLVSACPCALVLSAPVANFCTLLMAARTGLLVKGGVVLEDLAKTKVVAFDKTGTITRGEFTVMELQTLSSQVNMPMLLFWVSNIESKSSHPMASALVDHARFNSVEPKPEEVNNFKIYPGEGVSGELNGKTIYIGNRRISIRAGCEAVPNTQGMDEAATVGYVFLGSIPIGIFSLSDTCRTGAIEGIQELKSMGIKTAMLTGDSAIAAKHAQKQLGNALEVIHAELLPEDKVRIVHDLKMKEGSTTMVGDGMNDAPALAMANVGISMGISGSAVTMETSHITLMSNDICKIPKGIRIARSMNHKIIENIIFSITTKVAILILAFAGHPLIWAAVLADVGTCLIVILNSMMLLQTGRLKEKKCFQGSHAKRPTCTSHRTHGQPSFAICPEVHGCCGNEKEEGSHACCSSQREKHEGRFNFESHARCGQHQIPHKTNADHNPWNTTNCKIEHHKEDSCKEQSNIASHVHSATVCCEKKKCEDESCEEHTNKTHHTLCCQRSVELGTSACHEHLITVSGKEEKDCDDSWKKYVNKTDHTHCCTKSVRHEIEAKHEHLLEIYSEEEKAGGDSCEVYGGSKIHHSHCCQKSVADGRKASYENLITFSYEAEAHCCKNLESSEPK